MLKSLLWLPIALHAVVSVATQKPIATDVSRSSLQSTSELLSLHRQLIEIESISENEWNVGKWLARYLQEQGLEVEELLVSKDRFNVLAYPKGGRNSSLLVTSHIDTVPPYIPYSIRDETEIWGRGSVDAKASVAAQIIAALKVLKETDNAASLSLLFVIGEERDGVGMKHFSTTSGLTYDAVLFGEPTEATLASGHKGMMSFNIQVQGRAAHSGYPWLGLSATNILVDALSTLKHLEKHLPSSKVLGKSTLNLGRIQGGVAPNVVAEHAEADVSIRIAAGSPELIREKIAHALGHLEKETASRGGNFTITHSNRAYGPVHIDTDIPGFNSSAMNYGTDIPNLDGDHKRYLYGPGSIHVAHGPDEHLKISELEDAAVAFEKIIRHLLKI